MSNPSNMCFSRPRPLRAFLYIYLEPGTLHSEDVAQLHKTSGSSRRDSVTDNGGERGIIYAFLFNTLKLGFVLLAFLTKFVRI